MADKGSHGLTLLKYVEWREENQRFMRSLIIQRAMRHESEFTASEKGLSKPQGTLHNTFPVSEKCVAITKTD